MPHPQLTIAAINDAARQGKVSAEDMVKDALTRIDALNPRLKAFVHVTSEEALEDARLQDRLAKKGMAKGPLFGVPLAIKDIIDVRGMPTRGGSLTRKDASLAPCDATVVERLKAAGAIIIGKAATVEYAFGGWGTNETVGAPVNPWDSQNHRIPGGSSSGSGVAVASGMVPGALGSDTGGSIRLPASFSGLVGLKTTIGAIPTTGVLPLSQRLDTIGPMTRTVSDAARLFDCLCGYAEGTSLPSPQKDKKIFSGKRIGIPHDLGVSLHSDTARIWTKVIDDIERAGGHLVSVHYPKSIAEYAAPCGVFLAVDGYRNYKDLVEEEPNCLGHAVRRRMLGGRMVNAVEFLDHLAERDRNKVVIAQKFEEIDALMTPTTAFPAPILGEHAEQESPGVFTRFANYFDLAAISLPAGVTPNGLPVGIQFVVPAFHERRALDLASRLELHIGGPILCPLVGT